MPIADAPPAPPIAVTETAAAPEAQPSPRIRLDYLDGLRGLAALDVTFGHAYLVSQWQWNGGRWQNLALDLVFFLSQGRAAVAIFIVLSGYCLMLPVIRSREGALRGGARNYLKRRSWRILPPYYAALALCLLLIALVPGMGRRSGVEWDVALPAFTPGVLLSHVFLVHNLSADWRMKIDPPMWSIATEWQIYFLFPALLLPLWRRLGIGATVAAAFVLGLAPFLLFRQGNGVVTWFLGLFALGMAGACIGFPRRPEERTWRDRMPWGSLSGVLFLLFAAVVTLHHLPQFNGLTGANPLWFWRYIWAVDTLVGLATVCLLVFCTRSLTANSEPPLIRRVLEARWPVSLGRFSYSLYLVHLPVMALLDLALRQHFGLRGGPALAAALIVVGMPLSLAASYLFYLAFERRLLEAR